MVNEAFVCMEEAIERMGDKEIYVEIAQYFAGHIEESAAGIHAALMEETFENATRLAHSLKSNCATVGANSLREQCALLEALCKEGKKHEAFDLLDSLQPDLMRLKQILLSL